MVEPSKEGKGHVSRWDWKRRYEGAMQIPLSICHNNSLSSKLHADYTVHAYHPHKYHLPWPASIRIQVPPMLLIPLPLQDGNHGLRALTRRLRPMLHFVLLQLSVRTSPYRA